MITPDLKLKIAKALVADRANFEGSDKKYATSLDINPAILSRIFAGETERVLNDSAWIGIARRLNVALNNQTEWKTAETAVFVYIQKQLEACQTNSISSLLVDIADIGKTYAAQYYCRNHKAAVYIDCSQVKTKRKLVMAIAKGFGVNHTGKFSDMYDDLVYYLRSMPAKPLVVLDEAGDLQYEAFLELKALWNATEFSCGWAMIGADGLKAKIERSIEFKKVGYTEIFSRYGKRYQKITPDGADAANEFMLQAAVQIIRVNNPSADIKKLVSLTNGSLRRTRIELTKLASNG